jgi:addiction module RelE/StbE family toxin
VNLTWSPSAATDLEAIRDYIAADSPRYADLVVRRILHAVERLSDFPESGRAVPERTDESLREVLVSPFRVVYRLREQTVEIVTVFRATRMFREVPE